MGDRPLTLGQLYGKIAVKLTVNMVVQYVLTFGEELGWRGYLQPRMERRFGTRSGIILVGNLVDFRGVSEQTLVVGIACRPPRRTRPDSPTIMPEPRSR